MSSHLVADPATPQRPGTVSAAMGSLYTTAALLLVYLGTGMWVAPAAGGFDSSKRLDWIGSTVVAAWFISMASGLVALALLIRRPDNGSRLGACVVAGIIALACAPAAVTHGAPTTQVPTWITAIQKGSAAGVAVTGLIAVLLLVLPRSNEYFRRAVSASVDDRPPQPGPRAVSSSNDIE